MSLLPSEVYSTLFAKQETTTMKTIRTLTEIRAIESSISRSLCGRGTGISLNSINLTNPYDASSIAFTCYRIPSNLEPCPCIKGVVEDFRVIIKGAGINVPYEPII